MNWWNRFWRRQEVDEQLEKELAFHLEAHACELVAQGYEPEEARRRARLDLGGPEQVKEQCRDARGTRWLEDLLQDFRYALRMLRKNPGFASVALLTLALGTGATTVMFTVVNGVLLKPLSYPEPERLVALHGRVQQFGEPWGFSYPDFLDYQSQGQSVGPMAAWTYGGGTISEASGAEYAEGREISSELFSVLGVPLVRGRAFSRDEDRRGAAPVAIISYSLWQRAYGKRPDVIGEALTFEGKSYTIVGIAPANFQLDGQVDIFTPIAQNTELRMQNRRAAFIHVLARLAPDRTLAQAQTQLSLIATRLAKQYPDADAERGVVTHPLQQDLVGDTRATLLLLLGAVSLALLIACVNVASLLLARAVSRERELALRVALGASRGRLIRQCLTESGVLGLAGGVLGVLFAFAGLQPFLAMWPGGMPRAEEVQLDWRVLLFAVGTSLLCGFLFGLAPALCAPSRQLEESLKGGMRTVTGSSRRLHSGYVIAEIGLAVVLLVSAGMLGRTVLRLAALNPGVRVENVLTARVALSPAALKDAATMRAAWQEVQNGARSVPGVQSVALTDIVPMRVGENNLPYWASPVQPPPDQTPVALASSVTPDYLNVMGIPLRHGRFFNDDDRVGHPLVVVIDEILAQHAFGREDAVGKQLWIPSIGNDPVQIVGVVGHVRHWGLAGDDASRVRDQIYYPFAQVGDPLLHLFSSFMSITVRTNVPPLNLVESLQHSLRGAANDQVLYDVRTMEQLVNDSLSTQRFLLVLFFVFAGLALLLACIGIYGVLAYLMTQRVPEIGVRMALGASAGNVMWMVMRQSIAMILAGVAFGTIAALAAGRSLEHSVEGMRQIEPSSFAVMIPLLMAAALLASLVPARRASRIDPIRALRQE
ncbi:MAG TPA: ABC transporter permease [Candidatus Acidoferrales bacterium]|nr:ABC transporter permease [Candidatus Acidoferrales bacterium]